MCSCRCSAIRNRKLRNSCSMSISAARPSSRPDRAKRWNWTSASCTVTGCGRRCSRTTEPGIDQLKISKSGKGGTGVRIRFDLVESSVVEQLFAELTAVLTDETDDEVRRRLYPDAYADAEAAAAFRDLTETGLRLERCERHDECLDELRAGRSLRRTEVVLDADGTE